MAASRLLPDMSANGSTPLQPEPGGLFQTLRSMKSRDILSMVQVAVQKLSGEPVDDKKYFMEKAIQIASGFPLDSVAGVKLTNSLRNVLWNDLPHRPLLSSRIEDDYRMADGSNNNLQNPRYGAADTYYARTVPSLMCQTRNLPDPELIFDTLLARQEFKPHPTKISSFLFYLAIIITHDIFNTDPADPEKNLNSSYLDLTPLYGRNQDEQDKMRTFMDGRIKADCFANSRLLHQPPGVGVFLIMFNRWHNYVVEQLARINEDGRFTRPAQDNAKGMKKYDNDLFQTGRLITCNLYCNIIINDYVRTILNLNRADSPWTLDPRAELHTEKTTSNYATGNQVSREFNLVYRWHDTVSVRDEAFLDSVFSQRLNGKDPATTSWQDLVQVVKNARNHLSDDPQQWPLPAGLTRNEIGSMDDQGLASILTASIEEVAGAFGSNQVPKSLRAVEVLGILRARQWKTATLNEFREHFELKKHETFEDINPDPVVASTLKKLYGHPDNVELYVGVSVEAAKVPMVPGSGLCPHFTLSRAILSDATALVRGDRFYTIDCTPRIMTNWGFKVSGSDPSFNHGCVIHKLILNAFPHSYKDNSIYAHFPMTIPSENEVIYRDLGIGQRFDYGKPQAMGQAIKMTSHAVVCEILRSSNLFNAISEHRILDLATQKELRINQDCLFPDKDGQALYDRGAGVYVKSVQDFYAKTTKDLLSRHSVELAGRHQVNLVQDVMHLAHARFAAEMFCIPIKTKTYPEAPSEHEMYSTLAAISSYLYLDEKFAGLSIDVLRERFHDLATLVDGIVASKTSFTGWMSNWATKLQQSQVQKYAINQLEFFLGKGIPAKQFVRTYMVPTAASLTAQGRLTSDVMDFLLRPENKSHWQAVRDLCEQRSEEADELLKRYILEISRLRTSDGISLESIVTMDIQDGDDIVHVPQRSRVVADLSQAHQDANAFPDPDKIDLARPLDSYLMFGTGISSSPSGQMCLQGTISMLKVFASLKNLRKVPGSRGDIGRVPQADGLWYYLDEESCPSPYPVSMYVEWDDTDDEKQGDS